MNRTRTAILTIAIVAAGLFGSLVSTTPSVAQNAGTREALEAARELNAIFSKDLLKQMTTQITSQVWPGLERTLRSKRQDIATEQITSLRSEFERIQFEHLSSLMDDAPVIYARYFTAAELREMLAFHRSPVGQKSLRVLPQIIAESVALMTPRMKQIQTETMEAFTKVLRERGFSI